MLNLQLGYARDLLSTHVSQFLLFLKLIPTESLTTTSIFRILVSGIFHCVAGFTELEISMEESAFNLQGLRHYIPAECQIS